MPRNLRNQGGSAYSMTFGTRYSPASVWGAMAWKSASRRSLSLTARPRAGAGRVPGVAIGSTPSVLDRLHFLDQAEMFAEFGLRGVLIAIGEFEAGELWR